MSKNLRRPGYTLLEMVMMIPMIAMVLVVSMSWMHQTLKYTSKTRGYQRQHQQANRLVHRLRSDIRRGQSLSCDDKRLTIKNDNDSEINYSIDSNRIQLEHTANGNVIARDGFAFPTNTVLNWDTSELPNWVSLAGSLNSRHRQMVAQHTFRTNNEITANSNTSPTEESSTNPTMAKFFVRAGVQRYLTQSINPAAKTTVKQGENEASQ